MSQHAEDLCQRHRLTVDDYHRMADAGIFRPDDRIELVEGEIIDMVPIGSEHAGTVAYLARYLERAVRDLAIVSVQNPLVLNPDSEPQPDLALLRPRDDFYRGAHPTSSDVLLAVEVADTSLRFDREIEIPLYARHGLPEAWLVGVKNKCLTVFRAPMDDDYREVQEFRSPGFISFYALPKVRVDLHGLF